MRDEPQPNGPPRTVTPSRPTIMRYLGILEHEGMVERESTGRGTWLRIVNFSKYQDFDTYRQNRVLDTSVQENRHNNHGDSAAASDSPYSSPNTLIQSETSAKPLGNRNYSGSPDLLNHDNNISTREDGCTHPTETGSRNGDRLWLGFKARLADVSSIPPRYDPKKIPASVREALAYGHEVISMSGVDVTDTSIAEYMRDMLDRFFSDEDPFVVKNRHRFSLFVDRLPVYSAAALEGLGA